MKRVGTRAGETSPNRLRLRLPWGGHDFAGSRLWLAWRRLRGVASLRGGSEEATDASKGGARGATSAVESELLRRKEAMQRDERLQQEGEEEVLSKR